MSQRFLASLGARARLQGVQRRESNIRHQMIGRWRKGWPDDPLGCDTERALEARPGVGQVLLAIGAIELLMMSR